MAFARPAESLLASAVITDEELGQLFEDVNGGKPLPARSAGVLKSGSTSVDATLGGALERGRVVGVWGDAGGGDSEVGSPDEQTDIQSSHERGEEIEERKSVSS